MIQLRSSTGNRRVSSPRKRKQQQHLLNVKVRSRKASEQRNRAIMKALCYLVLLATVGGAMAYGVQQGLRRWLWENPDFILASVSVTTDGVLEREQVLKVAGIREGMNIFSVRLSDAQGSLAKLPQIERAELRRILPNKIAIEIHERRPVAWLTARPDEDPSASDRSFLVDDKGMLISGRHQLPEYLRLPVICGLATENLLAGEQVKSPEMRAALELVQLTADNGRFQVRSIDLSRGYCMLVTDRNRAQIPFALEGLDRQLERLSILFRHVDESRREIQTVNLMVERNMPVTFVSETETKASEPESKPASVAPAKPTETAKPAPKSAADSATKPKSKPDSKATPKTAKKATPKPASKPASKPVVKPTPKPEPVPVSTPVIEPEVRKAEPVPRRPLLRSIFSRPSKNG